MDLLKLAALCAVFTLPAMLVKKSSPEHSLLLILGVLLLALANCLQAAAPVLNELQSLFNRAGIESAYASILLRITAAAIVTKLCADLCRDGGSQALASAVELAGATASLVIAFPLVRAVTDMLLGFFT